jgi:hypothetical protein
MPCNMVSSVWKTKVTGSPYQSVNLYHSARRHIKNTVIFIVTGVETENCEFRPMFSVIVNAVPTGNSGSICFLSPAHTITVATHTCEFSTTLPTGEMCHGHAYPFIHSSIPIYLLLA